MVESFFVRCEQKIALFPIGAESRASRRFVKRRAEELPCRLSVAPSPIRRQAMKTLKYGAFIFALALSSAAFAGSSGSNGAGPAGGGDSGAPKAGGESGASSGTTGGTPTIMQSGRAAAEEPVGGVGGSGTSGQQRMGNGANGSNANNGVNGNTTGYGNSQTTNPMSQ
jgi:hypothetical protein